LEVGTGEKDGDTKECPAGSRRHGKDMEKKSSPAYSSVWKVMKSTIWVLV